MIILRRWRSLLAATEERLIALHSAMRQVTRTTTTATNTIRSPFSGSVALHVITTPMLSTIVQFQL